MTTFTYTDYLYTPESSVIDELFYNSKTNQLVVHLKSGALAGYDNVSLGTFGGLKVHYDARDEGGSIGSYWNRYIKYNDENPGFDTGAIEDFEDAAAEEANAPVVEDVSRSTTVTLTVPESKSEFSVGYSYILNGDTYEGDATVFAVSVDTALESFRQAASILGYNDVKVTSVTQFFS